MTTKTVPVTLPVAVWGRLVSVAESRNTTVPALLARAVESLTEPTPKRGWEGAKLADQRLAAIRPLRDAGWTWPQISAQTGIPYSSLLAIAKRHGMTKPRGKK
jgi:hypothetical protein